jgi:hypothetical protein
MGRRYLAVLLKLFFDRILVADDLMSERVAANAKRERESDTVHRRLDKVESALGLRPDEAPPAEGAPPLESARRRPHNGVG